jgi:DUF438 domain-containing protein
MKRMHTTMPDNTPTPDDFWKVPPMSKAKLYQELMRESKYNRVVPQALQDAADEAVKELLRDKKKLVESNKQLTTIALEIEEERSELESMLYKAAGILAPHLKELPDDAAVQAWLADLRAWAQKGKGE